ncbi:unnamed protein product, partial [Owenia fusiformis]
SLAVTKSAIPGLYVPASTSKYLSRLEHSKFIPFYQTRAAEFNTANKLSKAAQVKANKTANKAREILRATKDVLDKVGMKFWLTDGTLLGWYRQCDFIAHTNDVDVGTWITDFNPDLEKLLKRRGQPIRILYHYGKPSDGFELTVQGFDMKLDIQFNYKDANHTWTGGLISTSLQKVRWIYPLDIPLCSAELFDDLYFVPCDTVAIIEANYGPTWMLPDKKWIWNKSAHNLVEAGKFSESDRKEVVQIFQTSKLNGHNNPSHISYGDLAVYHFCGQ